MATDWLSLADSICHDPYRLVSQRRKQMLSPDEELQTRSGCNDIPRICVNCGHTEHHHGGTYGCEYEFGDEWVTGTQPSQPTVLMARGQCACKRFEPMDADDILADQNPESI